VVDVTRMWLEFRIFLKQNCGYSSSSSLKSIEVGLLCNNKVCGQGLLVKFYLDGNLSQKLHLILLSCRDELKCQFTRAPKRPSLIEMDKAVLAK